MINKIQTILDSTGLNTRGWCVVKMHPAEYDTCDNWHVRVDINNKCRVISKNQAEIIAEALRAGLSADDCKCVRVLQDDIKLGGYKAEKFYSNYDVAVYAHDSLDYPHAAEHHLHREFDITNRHPEFWDLGDYIGTGCVESLAKLRALYSGDAEKAAWFERLVVARAGLSALNRVAVDA